MKKFVCYWGAGYGNEHIVSHTLDFFHEDAGYEPDDIKEISALKVGQSWKYGYPSGDHFVLRVE